MNAENISIPKLLLKMSPPVMLALLIQSIYNIADSFFVARYSIEGLTALSIIYPVQLLITALATGIFFVFPEKLIQIFSAESAIVAIGKYALPVISISFIFAGLTIVITSYLQGIAHIKISLFIIILRQIFLLVPLAWMFHFIGLNAVWWTFPVTESIVSMTGILIILILHKQNSVI